MTLTDSWGIEKISTRLLYAVNNLDPPIILSMPGLKSQAILAIKTLLRTFSNVLNATRTRQNTLGKGKRHTGETTGFRMRNDREQIGNSKTDAGYERNHKILEKRFLHIHIYKI